MTDRADQQILLEAYKDGFGQIGKDGKRLHAAYIYNIYGDIHAENQYTADSSVTDHGAATTQATRSIKDLVDAIGTTVRGLIQLNNDNPSSGQTTYTLTTNESIPSNIQIDFKNGAIIGGAGTITFDNVDQIKALPGQQIFDLSSGLTVSFTKPTGKIFPEWLGAISDSSTDSTAAIQAAYTTGINDIVYVASNDYYKITDTITFFEYQNSIGQCRTKTQIVMTDTSKFAFKCQAVGITGGDWYTNQANGGSFKYLDIRARYGISVNTANYADSGTFDYASEAAFDSANVPIQSFVIDDCNLYSDVDYSAAYTYISNSPTFNTATVPSTEDLFDRGVGVLFSHVYRGLVVNSEIKFYGIGVWLYGSDLSVVDKNRIANNLRHVHIHTQHPAGFSCKVSNNDLLAGHGYGGVFIYGAGEHNIIEKNYFENTGGAGNSTVNYYIVDNGVFTNIISNRFDDSGSTLTSGGLLVFEGYGGGLCALNKISDHRPSYVGNLATITVSDTNYNPFSPGLSQRWGIMQMVSNDPLFPKVRNPLVQYNLDGNPFEWSPLNSNKNFDLFDISGGAITGSNPYAQDANDLWYYAPTGGKKNGIIIKPRQDQLGYTLDYDITIYAQSTDGSAPYEVSWLIKWVTAAGASSDLYDATKTYSTNTDIEAYTETVTLPGISEGYFIIYINESVANLYRISIVES
jgi:hypothetical protein